MADKTLDGVMGFSGVGGAENGGDPTFHAAYDARYPVSRKPEGGAWQRLRHSKNKVGFYRSFSKSKNGTEPIPFRHVKVD